MACAAGLAARQIGEIPSSEDRYVCVQSLLSHLRFDIGEDELCDRHDGGVLKTEAEDGRNGEENCYGFADTHSSIYLPAADDGRIGFMLRREKAQGFSSSP